MKYDFDKVSDREGTLSYKWDARPEQICVVAIAPSKTFTIS